MNIKQEAALLASHAALAELVRIRRREERGDLDPMDHDTTVPLAWDAAFACVDGWKEGGK